MEICLTLFRIIILFYFLIRKHDVESTHCDFWLFDSIKLQVFICRTKSIIIMKETVRNHVTQCYVTSANFNEKWSPHRALVFVNAFQNLLHACRNLTQFYHNLIKLCVLINAIIIAIQYFVQKIPILASAYFCENRTVYIVCTFRIIKLLFHVCFLIILYYILNLILWIIFPSEIYIISLNTDG